MQILVNVWNKTVKIGYEWLLAVLAAVTGIALVRSVFFINIRSLLAMNQINMNGMLLIMGTAVYVLFLTRLYRLFQKHFSDRKKADILALILFLIYFVTLIIFNIRFNVIPQYDSIHLQHRAFEMLETAKTSGPRGSFCNVPYFSLYPMQTPTMILLYWVYRISDFFGYQKFEISGGILNIISFSLTALGIYRVISLKGNHAAALTIMTAMMVNPVFQMYASYPYTDTVSMFMAVWGAYFCMKGFMYTEKKSSALLWILAGALLLCIGIKIRTTAGIIPIALVIWVICTKECRAKYLLILFIPCYLAVSFMQRGVYSFYNVSPEPEKAIPWTHFIKMGVNPETEGWYSQTDVAVSNQAPDTETRKQENLEEIGNRLEQMGFKGTAALFVRKIGTVWGSGNMLSTTFTTVRDPGLFYQYTIGGCSKYFDYYLQFSRSGVLLLMLAALFRQLKDRDRKMSMWNVAWFGAILFYLFSEAHNRYSMFFFPWMLIMSEDGLYVAEDVLSHIKPVGMKGIKYVFIAATIILLSLTAGKDVLTSSKHRDYIVLQPRYDSAIEDIAADRIRQTFTAAYPFDLIELNCLKDEAENNEYSFILQDEKGIIAETEFTLRQIADNGKLHIWLDPVVPETRTLYTMTIQAKDPGSGKSIGLKSANMIDMLPGGELSVSGSTIADDLQMAVYRMEDRPYTTMPFLLGMGLLIILCEFFAFDTKGNTD